MAISNTAHWDFRVTGNDNNGGGYNITKSGVSGSVDYSQADTPILSVDGTTVSFSTGGVTATLTASSAVFTAAMVGNFIKITGGANATIGWYEITAYTSSTVVTLDRTWSTGAVSGGSGNVGGSLQNWRSFIENAGTTNYVGPNINGGTYLWIKDPGSPMDFSTSMATTGGLQKFVLQGYGSTHGDNGRPTLRISAGASAVALIARSDGVYVKTVNLIFDGNSLTGATGCAINLGNNQRGHTMYNCVVQNFDSGVSSPLTVVATAGGAIQNCYFYNNVGHAVSILAGSYSVIDCVFESCDSGASSPLISGPVDVIGCIFRNITAAYAIYARVVLQTNTFSNNTFIFANAAVAAIYIYGNFSWDTVWHGSITGNLIVGASAAAPLTNGISLASGFAAFAVVRNNAVYHATTPLQNGSGTSSNQYWGDIQTPTVLTADPFIDAANGNFGLNPAAADFLQLRGGGYPNAWPGLAASRGYQDIGAIQHQDGGGERSYGFVA